MPRGDNWKCEYQEAHRSGDRERIERALALKAEHFPKKLYRYRRFDEEGRSLKEVSEGNVWLSSAAGFNDPFDCSLMVDANVVEQALLPRILAHLLGPKELPEPARSRILAAQSMDEVAEVLVNLGAGSSEEKARKLVALRQVVEERRDLPTVATQKYFREGTKIGCFTTVYDSMPMWAHYAADHSGFCVEYAVADLTDSQRQNLHPVVYSEHRFDFTEWLDPSRDKRFVAITAATHKARQWSYEDEWRFVVPDGLRTAGTLWRMPSPTALYISHNVKSAHTAALRELALGASVPLFEMTLHASRYGMLPKPYRG
jgi:hypothetical protein